MQSRRDQVQAQSYVLGRLTSALISAEPEAPRSPNRRTVTGAIVGLLIAALVAAGFGILGVLKPGGATAWKQPGVLVVEKETGSRYVLAAGRLRPVLNYASALLLFGKKPTVVSVSQASLAGVPHGQPVGIVGAPDALPHSAMTATAWTVCTMSTVDNGGNTGPGTVLLVAPAGATQPGQPLSADRAMVASSGQDSTFLVWHGQRLRLTQPWLVKVFGYDHSVVPVPSGWLDALPTGPDIGPVPVPGRGEVGPVIDGRPSWVGQLFVAQVAGNTQRYYLLRRDGLSELTGTGFAVAAGDPDTAKAYDGKPVVPIALSPAALAALPRSTGPIASTDLPATPPALADPNAADPSVTGPGPVGRWCIRQTIADGQVTVGFDNPGAAPQAAAGLGVSATKRTAAAIGVRPGTGGLVRSGRLGQASGSNYFLVTDAGVKYPLRAPSVATTLGYPVQDAATVPPVLLDLLPTGPLLDPQRVGR
jgi:type VII secretion protein EccB